MEGVCGTQGGQAWEEGSSLCLDWGLSMGWEPIAFMALCSPPRTKARCSLKSKYRHINPSPPHPVLRALGVPSILWLNPDQTGSRFAFKGKVRMRLQEFDDQGQGCWKGETEELSSSSLAFHLLPSSKVLAIYVVISKFYCLYPFIQLLLSCNGRI